MKFLKTVIIFSIGFLVSNCGFSKENNQNFDSDKKNISNDFVTKDKVLKCNFEHGFIDFCSDNYLKLYNNSLRKKANFAQNKVALVIDKERDTGKGTPRKVKYFVVLDPATKRVYPLGQSVGYFVNDRLEEIINEPPRIKFSQNNNQVCLSGTTFSYQDNNINVENECYKFNPNDKDFFKKVQKQKNIKYENSNFPITFEKKKFMCNGVKCKENTLTNDSLKEISNNDKNSELRFLVNERGFDTTYINASAGSKILYVLKYSEGDSEQENIYLSYFLDGLFKTKVLGEVKLFKIDSSQNVYFNGNKVILN
ncbi:MULTISPECIES: hypothetical protein [Acinetobacter]|uniref:hypothetical protein n=1 Tax=Acinetobacter TaxID=469 RepID=UPI002006219B|nr:hypothetical protein [Acinetobacter radioresistens]MCK4081078.1 hypothetical protein [Acinetobacter radioresistens]MCK4090052.1 hypothetical protein [Acinetobacter radioresistens]MCU4500410.1 hypothetical protein [Acinetobacter radioresistens]